MFNCLFLVAAFFIEKRMVLGLLHLVDYVLVVSPQKFNRFLEKPLSFHDPASEKDGLRDLVLLEHLLIVLVEFEQGLHGVDCALIVLVHVLGAS